MKNTHKQAKNSIILLKYDKVCVIIEANNKYFIIGGIMDENNVLKKFSTRKVLTIQQLIYLLKCSIITARRRLKEWKAHRSINKNGRYYVLPEVAVFGTNGLWEYRSIIFSRYGNLKETIIELITQSKAGLSGNDICKLVELKTNSSFISQFRDVTGTKREKHRGRFIYFSDDDDIYIRQKKEREFLRDDRKELLPDADAVVILVQYIKHPDISIEGLVKRVAEKGRTLEPIVIRNFLEHHNLLKKTEDTQ